jgi:hypothetical protein
MSKNKNEELKPSEAHNLSDEALNEIIQNYQASPETEIPTQDAPVLSEEPIGGGLKDQTALQPITEEESESSAETQPQVNRLAVYQLGSSVPDWLIDPSSIEGAIELYLDFNPTDATESILARLAVGLTNATMDGLDRANRAGLKPEVRHMEVKLSHKGSAAVVDVLKMLETHRRADRNISVKNVNVGNGGKAIVGNVRTGRSQEEDKE